MSIEEIASALNATRSGDGYMARCPAHSDPGPSLKIDERDGKILLHCFGGCSQEAVIDALRGRGLWGGSGSAVPMTPAPAKNDRPEPMLPVPPDAPEKLRGLVNSSWAIQNHGKCVLISDYRDADGGLHFSVARYEKDGKKKTVPYYYGVDGRWHAGQPMRERRPLLNLPEIAANPEMPVLLVEGEKCAAVKVPGFITSTWCGGSSGVKYSDFAALVGRTVFIWPDHDNPGRKAAEAISRILPNARTLVIPANKPQGWDIADAAGEGENLEAFIRGHLPDEDEVSAPEANVKDYGHARVLAPFFIGRIRWSPYSRKWMRYDGTRWAAETEERVANIATKMLRKEYSRRAEYATERSEIEECAGLLKEVCVFARMQGALSFLKGWTGIHTSAKEWDSDQWLLNCNNGTVDLRAGELRPHRAEDMLTKLAPVNYNPEAKGEKWQAHLDLFLPDKSIQRQVQRDLGFSLPGVTLEEWLGIWYGTGGNGKTTTSRIIMSMLGDYSERAAPNLLVQQSGFDRHPTEIADLAAMRIVFSIEIDQGKKLAESLVKELTGGDTKKARRMREDFTSFEQTFSIILLVNHRPEIEGTDEGIWRRIRLVPWNETISSDKKRPQEDVVAELTAEGPAILNWLLAGLSDWQGDRRWIAEGVQAATEEYREQSDRIGPFLKERCERHPRYRVPLPELQYHYVEWCAEQQEDPLSKREFEKLLRDHGLTTKKEGKAHISMWQGIRILRRTEANSPTVYPLREDHFPGSNSNTVRQSAPTAGDSLSDHWKDHDTEGPDGLF